MAAAEEPFVVVGGGTAGAAAVRELAQAGAPVLLVAQEPNEPYDRTHLSKKVLLESGSTPSSLWKKDETWPAQVDLRLGIAAETLDPANQTLTLVGGERIRYAGLLLATGARPRRLDLPGLEGPRVFYLRELSDAVALEALLDAGSRVPGSRIAVIGGGLIGLEVTAAAVTRGVGVDVVEVGPRVLGRGVPEAVAERLAALHVEHGVRLHTDARPIRVHRAVGGEVVSLELEDGSTLSVDALVIGIGVIPEDALATSAGLETDDGILVDPWCRTSAPHVYAAGDATRMRGLASPAPPLLPRSTAPSRGVRLESFDPAQHQGEAAARAMLSDASPEALEAPAYADVSWTWSDQYDWSLESVGQAPEGASELVIGEKEAVLVLTHLGPQLYAATGAATGTQISRVIGRARAVIAAGAPVDLTALAAAASLEDVENLLKAAA